MTVHAAIAPGDRRRSNAVGYLAGDDARPDRRSAPTTTAGSAPRSTTPPASPRCSRIARALAAAGHRPRHRLCFTSRTAEEYGLAGPRVRLVHRRLAPGERRPTPSGASSAPFHLCLEASGHPDLRLTLEAPVELTRWVRAAGRVGEARGLADLRLADRARPSPGTEQWPLLVAGVPGVSGVHVGDSRSRRPPTTRRSTRPEIVDFDHLERLTRFYAYLLLEADADPDGILDHRARARQLTKHAGKLGGARRAARRRRPRRTRARAAGPAFTRRRARAARRRRRTASSRYPHEQAAADVAALEAALAALDGDDRAAAAKQLAKVGENALAPMLSQEAFTRHARPDAGSSTTTTRGPAGAT